MVYRGPRQGCINCKRRRRKCDNVEPTCGICLRTSDTCVRSDHALDAVLRDQSAKVAKDVTKRRGVQVRQESESIFTSLRPNPDVRGLEAVFWFMHAYVPKLQDYQSSNGYLEYLKPVFLKAAGSAPIVHATTAIAVWLQEAWSDLFPETNRSRRYLGKALKSINEALADPDESIQDGTLMAILLLDLYDSLSSLVQSRTATETHFDGMLALIKHRDQRNYETDTGRRLMLAVRHQVLAHANAKGFMVDETSHIWNENESESVKLPGNKATSLDTLCLKLNRLNVAMRDVTERDLLTDRVLCSGTGSLPAHLYDLLVEVNALDRSLQGWYDTVPNTWQPLAVAGAPDFDMYDSSCNVYLDLNVATVINNYRVHRAMVLKWRIQLASIGGGFWTQQESLARTTLQQLVDEFCASVPFYLGNKFTAEEFGDPKIFYPVMPNDPERNRSNAIQALTLGGLVLLGLVRSMLDISAPSPSISPPLLQPSQRKWLKRQLLRIAVMYNVRLNPDNFGSTLPPLIAEDAANAQIEDKVEVDGIGHGLSIRI